MGISNAFGGPLNSGLGNLLPYPMPPCPVCGEGPQTETNYLNNDYLASCPRGHIKQVPVHMWEKVVWEWENTQHMHRGPNSIDLDEINRMVSNAMRDSKVTPMLAHLIGAMHGLLHKQAAELERLQPKPIPTPDLPPDADVIV